MIPEYCEYGHYEEGNPALPRCSNEIASEEFDPATDPLRDEWVRDPCEYHGNATFTVGSHEFCSDCGASMRTAEDWENCEEEH